ncbi:lipopolysaccharide biosynthesis protein [Vibrio diabolicus]|uniref:lipopolysaccharide biosynthesis protein n=1 Tax=Vibrio diabolicus TaxID=50719 RepID=UPI00062E63A3|nr:hypothetical protein [Vibrio diabolicus]KLE24598.1 hypothetical protein AAW52_09320 [Vibrio diabolicus]
MNKLFKILSMGAGSTIGVSVVAIIIQMSVVSYLSRTAPEYVAFIAIFELFTAWVIALCFFGGEQHFINVFNRSKTKAYVLSTYLITYFLLLLPFSFAFFTLHRLGYVNIGGFEVVGLYLVCVTIGLAVIIAAYFRSQLKILLASSLEKLTVCLVYIILLVISFYEGNDLDSYLIIFSIFYICMLLYFVRNDLSISKDTACISKDIFNQGGFYFFSTLLIILIYERIDQMVILDRFDLTDLAGYFACFKLAFLIRFVSKSVNSAMYPYLSKLSSNDDIKAVELFKDIKLVNFLIALILSLPLILFSDGIIGFIYGDQFVEYSQVLKIMAIALIVSVSNQSDFNLMNSRGYSNFFLINSILTVIVQCTVIILLINSMGVFSLVLAKYFAVICGFIFSTFLLVRNKVPINKVVLVFVSMTPFLVYYFI